MRNKEAKTVEEYLNSLSKKRLKRIIMAYHNQYEPLGCDADIRFRPAEVDLADPEFSIEAGFYCSHTGENVEDRDY